MKKLYFLTALLFVAPHIFSQTLFTYGKDAVTKDEFLRAYNKNKTSSYFWFPADNPLYHPLKLSLIISF